MFKSKVLTKLLLLTIFLSPLTIAQQGQTSKERQQPRQSDRITEQQRDKMHDQTATHGQEKMPEHMKQQMREHERIYGQELMTEEERLQFHEQLRAAKTEEERLQLMAEHRVKMQARAKERGVKIKDDENEAIAIE